MNFSFLQRSESRKYNYKSQYFVPEDEKPTDPENFDPNKFGDKLRTSWERRRYNSRKSGTSNMRTVIWLAFIIFVLGFLGWKFLWS